MRSLLNRLFRDERGFTLTTESLTLTAVMLLVAVGVGTFLYSSFVDGGKDSSGKSSSTTQKFVDRINVIIEDPTK